MTPEMHGGTQCGGSPTQSSLQPPICSFAFPHLRTSLLQLTEEWEEYQY